MGVNTEGDSRGAVTLLQDGLVQPLLHLVDGEEVPLERVVKGLAHYRFQLGGIPPRPSHGVAATTHARVVSQSPFLQIGVGKGPLTVDALVRIEGEHLP